MTPYIAAKRVFSIVVAILTVSACATPGGTVAVVAVGNVTKNNAHLIGSAVKTIAIPKHRAPSGRSALSSIAPANVQVLPLDDDRRDIDVEGTVTAALGVPMGRLRFDPGPTTLLGQAIVSEVVAAGHTVTDGGEGMQITGSVLEFEAQTSTTPLYWDVVGRLALSLKVAARTSGTAAPLDYRAACTDRTYTWPTEEFIAGVMNKCISEFASRLRVDGRLATALSDASATTAVAERGRAGSAQKPVAAAPRGTTDRSHTSADHRWSVSFPGDWTLTDSDRFVKISKGSAILGIHHTVDVAGQSLDEAADAAIREWEQQMKKVNVVRRVSRQRATLAGHVPGIAIVHHIGTGEVGQSRKVIVVAGDRRYLIDAETYLASWPDFEREFDQIIGSFRILQ